MREATDSLTVGKRSVQAEGVRGVSAVPPGSLLDLSRVSVPATQGPSMEYNNTKPQLSSRANAFSIAALMSTGNSKDRELQENTIKPLGKSTLAPTLAPHTCENVTDDG